MTDVALLLATPGLETTAHPPNSRYHGHPVRTRTLASGTTVKHLAPRVPPQPDAMTVLGTHRVAAGERVDALAQRYLGDPHLLWRLADANAARVPSELTERPGRSIGIAVADGRASGR